MKVGLLKNYGSEQSKNSIVLIAGPTASGKSGLALSMAKELDAVIINADSMQVYSVLDVLSARPQAKEMAEVEHFLYGFLSPKERCSTGEWLRAVEKLLLKKELQGRKKIFVGGTGLYFKALIDGIASIPEISPAIIDRITKEISPLSRQERVAVLARRDPLMAKKLLEPDRQRLIRALSVLEGTGRSLSLWQGEKQQGLLGSENVEKIVLNPPRNILAKRIEQRFLQMFEGGAVAEVKALLALDLDPSLPLMKAIGVREISSWLAGDISQNEAIEKAIIASRQYAKRQRTWFRRQMGDWEWRESFDPKEGAKGGSKK